MSAVITVTDVRRLYGDKAAVDGVSLTLQPGRIACLLGPSGCGKSTLLRLIAGLEPVDGGEISSPEGLLSSPRVHIAPERRDIGFVFQDYALFPHLTVEQNVGFGLRKLDAATRRDRTLAELAEVHLAHRKDAWPQGLSGGEQQRVALARAMVRRPSLILLDEPFSGLDGQMKAQVRDSTLRVLRDAGAAALIVTHDAEEAMMMADDLALMEGGRILQTGAPRDCYLNPVSAATARLLGATNLLPATVSDGLARTAFGDVPAKASGSTLMVRPEGLILGSEGTPATVTGALYAGATVVLTLKAGGVEALVRVAAGKAPVVGDTVKVTLDPNLSAIW